jgi:glycerol-3-phosphate cytidylyltransferase-like family protein
VLGDRKRRHLQPHRFVEQLVDPARAIQQRELCMEVKMDEIVHASDFSLLSSSSSSVRGSRFEVRCSVQRVPNAEHLNMNAEPNGEHEPSSENSEG